MSALSDWFYNNVYGGSDLAAQGKSLDQQLQTINNRDYGPGGRIYDNIAQTQGTAAADQAFQYVQQHEATGSYDYQVNQDLGDGPKSGFGSLITDLFVLVVIGGALWAFFNFGGAAFLKRTAGKWKWFPIAAVAGVLLLAWLIYSRVKKTGSDANTAASDLGSNVKTIFSL